MDSQGLRLLTTTADTNVKHISLFKEYLESATVCRHHLYFVKDIF